MLIYANWISIYSNKFKFLNNTTSVMKGWSMAHSGAIYSVTLSTKAKTRVLLFRKSQQL